MGRVLPVAHGVAGPDMELLFRQHGLNYTPQRGLVARVVLFAERHLGAEEIHARVNRVRRVGLATVYRTLQLLTDSGLVEELNFGDGWRRYERQGGSHHDHLICVCCGRVIEFREAGIERLQESVASRHGFAVESHRLELYGRCRSCEAAGARASGRAAAGEEGR